MLFVCLFDLSCSGSIKNDNLGQIVEKPRGDLEKVLPREDLKPRDVPKANPRVCRRPQGFLAEGLAEGGLQFTLEGLH